MRTLSFTQCSYARLHRGGKTLDEIDEGCTHLQFAIRIVPYRKIVLIQSTGFFVGSEKDKKDCGVPVDIDYRDPPLPDQGRFRGMCSWKALAVLIELRIPT